MSQSYTNFILTLHIHVLVLTAEHMQTVRINVVSTYWLLHMICDNIICHSPLGFNRNVFLFNILHFYSKWKLKSLVFKHVFQKIFTPSDFVCELFQQVPGEQSKPVINRCEIILLWKSDASCWQDLSESCQHAWRMEIMT